MNEISETFEPKKHVCPRCGYGQTFDEAYLDSGLYCPNCDHPVNIPIEYWEH